MLFQVIKCECGSKKVADPRGKPIEHILQQKWCSNCSRRGYWRTVSSDESIWDR
jgi:hypothetical protein